ncbi:unnamed protein product [Phytomonas sp. Hart1]|nr:unnamed protein product [Phytomonas sp. Hart1]|eukprot:CCW68664.1 unnamed protein product [Phytomonas sp. isolate Hart1]
MLNLSWETGAIASVAPGSTVMVRSWNETRRLDSSRAIWVDRSISPVVRAICISESSSSEESSPMEALDGITGFPKKLDKKEEANRTNEEEAQFQRKLQ